jgi:hypothetical protein
MKNNKKLCKKEAFIIGDTICTEGVVVDITVAQMLGLRPFKKGHKKVKKK